MNLPFGGYGVLGVCNDSAALIDFALRGETNMYPLISTGRFLMHSARRLMLLREYLRNCQNQQPDNNSLELAIHDIRLLITAACNMGSDIHNSPCHLVDATSRYLANYPVSYFQLTQDSKEMMTKVAKLYEEFVHVEGGHREKSSTSIPREKEEEQTPNFLDFVFHNRGPPKK